MSDRTSCQIEGSPAEGNPAGNSIFVAAMASIDPQVSNDSIKIVSHAVNEVLNTDDICNPDPKAIFSLLIKLERSFSQSMYKDLSNMLENSLAWMENVATRAAYYYMQSMLTDFFKHFRTYCRVLNEFISHATKENDQQAISRHFRTVIVAYNNLEEAYTIACDSFIKRDELEPKEWTSYLWQNKSQFLGWGWRWKYTLYIAGMLIYNGVVHVTVPSEGMLNTLVKMGGLIFYTFSTDKIAAGKLLSICTSFVASIIWKIMESTPYIGKLIEWRSDAPQWMKKLFTGVNTAVFYLFLIVSLDYVQSILASVGIAIIQINAAQNLDIEKIGPVWSTILDGTRKIGNNVITAGSLILYHLGSTGGIFIYYGLREGFRQLFIRNMVDPIAQYLRTKAILDVSGFIKRFGDWWFSSGDRRNLYELDLPADERALNLYNLVASSAQSGNRAELTIVQKYDKVEIVSVVVRDLTNKLQMQGLEVIEKVSEEIGETMKIIMSKQGTLSLFQALSSSSGTDQLMTTLQVTMLFIVISIVDHMFGF